MIVDLGDKIVLRQEMAGQLRCVAFIEYTEHTDERRVVAGPIESLPHLNAYEIGKLLVGEVRDKYQRPQWSFDTEVDICRPEYLAMINRSIADGFDFFDFIGDVAEDAQGAFPTPELWRMLAKMDQEIDQAGGIET